MGSDPVTAPTGHLHPRPSGTSGGPERPHADATPPLVALRCLSRLGLQALRQRCSPLQALNRLVPDHTHRHIDAIAYGDHARQTLDLYLPLGDAPDPGWPVLLFLYGGSWQSGDRAEYRFLGEALAARGIVTAIADYRLHPEVGFRGFLQDSAAALAWLRRELAAHGGDAARLFVAGHSAGAYNAAMLALDARWLAPHGLHPAAALSGWIGIAGPYDFWPLFDPALMAIFNPPDDPETTPADTQPIFYAGDNAPPALLVAALEDSIVYPGINTGGLSARLRDLGVPVTERYYASANHYTVVGAFAETLRPIAPVLDDVCAFVGAR
jgi:acetyl esterase/lipase